MKSVPFQYALRSLKLTVTVVPEKHYITTGKTFLPVLAKLSGVEMRSNLLRHALLFDAWRRFAELCIAAVYHVGCTDIDSMSCLTRTGSG